MPPTTVLPDYRPPRWCLLLCSSASLASTVLLGILPRLFHCGNWFGPVLGGEKPVLHFIELLDEATALLALAPAAASSLPDTCGFRFLRMLDNPAALAILAFLAASALLLFGPKVANETASPSPEPKGLASWFLSRINSLFRAFQALHKRDGTADDNRLRRCVCFWECTTTWCFVYLFIRVIIYNACHTPGALVQLLCCGCALLVQLLCGLAVLNMIKKAREAAEEEKKRIEEEENIH